MTGTGLTLLIVFWTLLGSGIGLAQASRDAAQVHVTIARMALRDKQVGLAATELKKARALDPENALVHYALADALKDSGPDEALVSLERALHLGLPDHEHAASRALKTEILYRLARKAADEVFVDPATDLMWTRKDNADDINWTSAIHYCQNLTLQGKDDWRLPTIEELEQMSDRRRVAPLKIKPPLALSGCCPWSSNAAPAGAWLFAFNFGQRWVFSGTLNTRALCVRSDKR